MPIDLTPFEHGTLCFGNTWSIADESALALNIARVALGQDRHIQKILAGASLAAPPTTPRAGASAVKLLTVPAGQDPWHRDGWMFQVLSWIAAYRASPTSIIRAPQMISAQKGFDGLELLVDTASGKIKGAVIFEDKATDDPRTTIRDKVWPESAALELGESENVLVSEVVGLLATRPDIDSDAAIERVLWDDVRRYRISITVGDTHASEQGRRRLFDGYDTVASGEAHRRRAETLHVLNLRAWMQTLAEEAIAAIHDEVKKYV
ncbi:hypothetical protein [Burkholderia sp. 8Y]|uniref:hypothetical protein n=1 Tax=Burkholderia sp. 8Y TaxID=2653133 RepID=UPI0013594643|nr:hypothetical protein [Burkholderia sp. 8Y]